MAWSLTLPPPSSLSSSSSPSFPTFHHHHHSLFFNGVVAFTRLRHRRNSNTLSHVPSVGKEDTDLRVSSLQEQQLGEDDDGDDEPTPQDIEYVAQIKRVLELLRKNRDMLFGEVKLTIMIEDPREVERRRLLGIEDLDGPTREDLVDALDEINEGKIPKDRASLQMLAEELASWPNLEKKKTSPFPRILQLLMHLKKKELKKNKQKNSKALFTLQQAVTDPIFPRIMGAKTTKEAWNTLQEEFQRSVKVQVDDSWLWHRRFGHFNKHALKLLYEKNMMRDLPSIKENNEVCEGCLLGKQHPFPFSTSGAWRAKDLLELIHTDVCGPMRTPSHQNNRYFILFIDDFSKMAWVYFLKEKSKVFGVFKKFKALAENQSGKWIKVLRSDRGKEYTSREFERFCEDEGIERQLTVAYSP
ncbi:Ycf3-interacting protein 1, chloroplastic [Glycine soja]|uniref:Ycf3-interacting protein 1, chloroplastic n=1 Tax=Glycine soja TaxID=3848 RepID=A0A445GGJ0_GLYSO|nr:Ycf3-interacting protein 1, chloroplastic [Glycine soja]